VSIPDKPYLPLLNGVTFEPVFIMGDHRSGTTLLYQVLTRSGAFNYVSAYHLICYHSVLTNHAEQLEAKEKDRLGERFARLGLSTRKIDNVKLTPDLPEEYGFLFKQAGPRPKLSSTTFPLFDELCRKVEYTSASSRPLLLKNPWDFNNFMYIRARIPQARFIFLHRYPLATINSQLKAARSIVSERNPYSALLADWYRDLFDSRWRLVVTRFLFSSQFGFRTVLRHVVRASDYFLQHVPQLAAHEYTAVTYEDLCRDPEETVEKILSFVGVCSRSHGDFGSMIRPRQIALEPEVERNKTVIGRRLSKYIEYVGYAAEAP
jgi:hypothetical protein